MSRMVIASAGFTSWPGWVPAGVLVAALVGVLTIWLTWKLVFSRQRLQFSVLDTALIARDGHVRAPDLKISYRGEVVQAPHVVRIQLVARSGRDIPSLAFDNGKPLELDIGTRVVEVLQWSATLAKVGRSVAGRVEISPQLIRRRAVMTIDLLVDGEPLVQVNSPLIDVDVQRSRDDPDSWLAIRVAPLIFLACIALVVGTWAVWGRP